MGVILSDGTIRKLLEGGSLIIDPIQPSQIQPASVDVRLGEETLDEMCLGAFTFLTPVF